MNSIAQWFGATILAVGVLGYPQVLKAGSFTGDEFLTWDEDAKRGYIDAQLVMASSIAARIKPELSQCMANAFYGPRGLTDEGYAELVKSVAEFRTYHPSSVFVVMIEKTCGPFD